MSDQWWRIAHNEAELISLITRLAQHEDKPLPRRWSYDEWLRLIIVRPERVNCEYHFVVEGTEIRDYVRFLRWIPAHITNEPGDDAVLVIAPVQ